MTPQSESMAKYDGRLLSIIVPSFNMEAYLPKCLGSLIVDDKKMLHKLDVIVVNDGSKDRTSEIAHKFEANYPGVFRVIDKPNGNYGSCINAALKQLRGKFVKVLDADDEYDSDGLSRFLTILDMTEADLVLTDWVDVYPQGQVVKRRHSLPAHELLATSEFLKKSKIPFHAGITYRTNVFERFNYSQAEGISYTDLEWDVLPLTVVKSVIYVPESVYRYTAVREGQSSGSKTQCKNLWMILKMYLDLVRQYEVQRRGLAPEIQEPLDRFVAQRGEGCYRRKYIHKAPADIDEFDEELKKSSKHIYDQIACQRSGRIGVSFALLHRKHSFTGKVRIWFYSLLLRLMTSSAKVFRR